MDFSVIARAGLRQKDFADLVGVSRLTVVKWVNGQSRPNRFVAPRAKRVLLEIEQALVEGKLPLPEVDRKSAVMQALLLAPAAHDAEPETV